MLGIWARLTAVLNSWDEICIDENARLRTNTILCMFLVSGFYVSMLVFGLIKRETILTVPTFIMSVITVALLILQVRSRAYKVYIAWSFGVMAIGMSLFLLYDGGAADLSYIWIFIVPLVAIMVVPVRASFVYNAILLGVIYLVVHTPLRDFLKADYPPGFGTLFPIALLFVTGCGYLAELVRWKTQAKLKESAKKLESFAFTDPLTGAYNRHALRSHFGEVASAPAHGLSFGVCDLDFFKKVNDVYGHFAGDKMLCHVVQCMWDVLPADALLYRWGGEEFLIILKTDDRERAQIVLEKVRRKIAEAPLDVDGAQIGMTVSIGAVCAEAGDLIQTCIARADKQLYGAKEAGRNRLMMENSRRRNRDGAHLPDAPDIV
ncbi:GGDEF domain-containing protein [Oscillospiraceae bacterium OttesenSCG-928-F05]|nr:GGDEF domain-containing protein [Oscillospiraceae bacterium OttesenSCG-928-F05]